MVIRLNRLLISAAICCSTIAVSKHAAVTNIKSQKQLHDLIKSSDKPVVAKLYTMQCPACVAYEGPFNDFASKESGKAIFASANLNEVSQLGNTYKIGHIPATLIFKAKDFKKPVKIIIGTKLNEVKAELDKLSTRKMTEKSEEKEEAEVVSHKPAKTKQSGLKDIASREEFDNLVRSKKTVIIQLSKEDCVPCKDLAPIFASLAQENPEDVYSILDKDDVPDLVQEHKEHILGYPTYLIYKGGDFQGAFTGASQRNLKGKIDNILGKQTGYKTVRVSAQEAESMMRNPVQSEPSQRMQKGDIQEQEQPMRSKGKRRLPKRSKRRVSQEQYY